MSSTQTTDLSRYNVDDSHVGLDGYSPVSYVDLGAPQRGSAEFFAEHGGVKYYFTDAAQRDRFLADPRKYAPAFGGWCAFGMSVNQRFRCDPSKFKVVNGRLMMFLNDIEVDAASLWADGDEAELLAKAEQNWSRYSA